MCSGLLTATWEAVSRSSPPLTHAHTHTADYLAAVCIPLCAAVHPYRPAWLTFNLFSVLLNSLLVWRWCICYSTVPIPPQSTCFPAWNSYCLVFHTTTDPAFPFSHGQNKKLKTDSLVGWQVSYIECSGGFWCSLISKVDHWMNGLTDAVMQTSDLKVNLKAIWDNFTQVRSIKTFCCFKE